MATSTWDTVDRLLPYLKTLGQVALLGVGLGMLLEAIGTYIDAGYIATSRFYAYQTVDGLTLVTATLFLVLAVFAIIASLQVNRGNFPKNVVIGALVVASISLFVTGGGMLMISTSGSTWVTNAALAITAGVILLIATFMSLGLSVPAKTTGAIFAFAFAILLTARYAQNIYPGGFYQYLYYGHYITGFYSLFYSAGLGWSNLVFWAYFVLALALLLYAFLAKSKLASLVSVVAMVGFLLYAIDMASGNLGALSSTNWTYVSSSAGTQITPVIAEVVLGITSFIIMAASIFGIVYFAGGLMGAMAPSLYTPGQAVTHPAAAAVAGKPNYCPKCGTKLAGDEVFCKNCGTRLQ